MAKFPKDCNARIIGAEARKLVHYKFSSKHWEYHEITGCDNGTDCTIELVENEEWTNKKIEGQIKGSLSPKKLKRDNAFSLEIDIKTVQYGLGSSSPYIIFFADISREKVYYLPLQDYFISNPFFFDKIAVNSNSISLHIPCDNLVSEEDFELQQIAKSVYVDGPSKKLHKVV